MRRILSVLLVAAALLLAAVPVSAQSGKGGDAADRPEKEKVDRPEDRAASAGGNGRGRSGNGADDGAPNGSSGDDRGQRGQSVGVGRFESEGDGQVNGTHVRFTYNESGIYNFSADNVSLFDLAFPLGEPVRDVRADDDGTDFELKGRGIKVKAHDNPSGVLKMSADTAARFSFENATLQTVNGRHVKFTVGNVSGDIRAGSLLVQDQTLDVVGEVIVHLDQSRGPHDKHRKEIGEAVVRGHVGAEATIVRSGGGNRSVVDEVVSYGNVTVSTLRAERGNLTLAIEGHGTEGRVVVLNVDGQIVGAERKEDLTVFMDNLSIAEASDLPDVLDPDNDGFLPEYYVVFDPGTQSFQLLVSVPHYSVHILSVNAFIPLPPPPVIFGLVVGVAVLVPSGWALFRRPRRDA